MKEKFFFSTAEGRNNSATSLHSRLSYFLKKKLAILPPIKSLVTKFY